MKSVAAGTNAASGTPRPTRRRPRTEEELYAREEALAMRGVLDVSRRTLEELSEATGIGESVRRHPLLAVVIASAGGAAAAKVALRALRVAASACPASRLIAALSRDGWDELLARALGRLPRA